jgi:hypothetical protein
MIYRLAKSNRLISYLIFPLIALAFWIPSISREYRYKFFEGEDQMVLFKPVYLLVENSPLAMTAISFLLLILAAMILQRINSEFGFFRIKNVLPPALFVYFVCGLSDLQTLHPVYFSLIFVLLAIYRIFSAFDLRKPFSQVFEAGFLLGTGAMFYLNSAFLLPAIVAGGMILGRETRWREMVLTIAGFLTPWFFAFTYFFLNDDLPAQIEILTSNLLTTNPQFENNAGMMVYLGYIGLLIFFGSINMIRNYEEKKISIRQYYLIFFLIFASSVFVISIVPSASEEMLLISLVPVSFLVSNLTQTFRRNILSEILLYLVLGLSIYLKLTAL